MKFAKTVALAALLTCSASSAFAWTRVATCGTGDAVAGVDVFTDGEAVIVQILSQDDTQKPEQYSTMAGAVQTTSSSSISALLKKISKGREVSLVMGQEGSFGFGGAFSKAALFNLKVNKTQSFDRNSNLAVGGQVISLFCNQPKGE